MWISYTLYHIHHKMRAIHATWTTSVWSAWSDQYWFQYIIIQTLHVQTDWLLQVWLTIHLYDWLCVAHVCTWTYTLYARLVIKPHTSYHPRLPQCTRLYRTCWPGLYFAMQNLINFNKFWKKKLACSVYEGLTVYSCWRQWRGLGLNWSRIIWNT